MANYIKFKGVGNWQVGAIITQMPNVPTPEARGESVVIPGRNGALWIPDGAYDVIAITTTIWVEPSASLDTARIWLAGEGNLELGASAATYYKARVSGGVEFAPLGDGMGYQAAVRFECQPFRYIKSYATGEFLTSGTLTNSYAVYAEPKITVTGSGNARITIGTTVFALENIVSGMILDTELQEAYLGATLYNDRMTGAFPVLAPGNNAISWTGSISKLTIDPRWRTL